MTQAKLQSVPYDTHGHFTQPDSITGSMSNPKTLTAYNYAGSDPINSADPNGRCIAGLGNLCDAFADANLLGNVRHFAGGFGLAGLVIGCVATSEIGCVEGAGAGGTAGELFGVLTGLGVSAYEFGYSLGGGS